MEKQINPILVLLPGLDGTGKLFKPFTDTLPKHIKTMVISYPADSTWTIDHYASYVEASLPDCRMVLLAESFSGLVAMKLLENGSERFDAAVFCASFSEPPRKWLSWFKGLIPYTGWIIRFTPSWAMALICLGSLRSNLSHDLQKALQIVPKSVLAHRLYLVASTAYKPVPFTVPYFIFRPKMTGLYHHPWQNG